MRYQKKSISFLTMKTLKHPIQGNLLVVVLVAILPTLRANYNCIGRCACSLIDSKELKADCTALNLSEIPTPEKFQVNTLLMNFNRMTRIRKDAFIRFDSLHEISLSGNRIRVIEKGAFKGLDNSNLRRLDISSNSLMSVPHSEMNLIAPSLQYLSLAYNALRNFPDSTSAMKKLIELDISHNSLIKILPQEPFPSSLETLNLSYTSIQRFESKIFANLTLLRNLKMNDNLAAVRVNFERGIFDNMIKLEHLDLSRCFCKGLPQDTFTKLRNLRTLLLSASYLRNLPMFHMKASLTNNKSNDLQMVTDFPLLQTENRSDIVVSSNGSNIYTTSAYEDETTAIYPDKAAYDWYNPHLLKLDMSHNKNLAVAKSDDGGDIYPPSLSSLELSYTSAQNILNKTFSNLKNISNLEICSSHVYTIEKGAFTNLQKLTSICLSGNRFRQLPKLPTSVQTVNMTNSKIVNLTQGVLGNLEYLVEADWSGGKLSYIETKAFMNMLRLKRLNLSDNNLEYIGDQALFIRKIGNSSCLEILDLSKNPLRVVNGPAFNEHFRLRLLYMHDGLMTEITEQTLMGLTGLNVLDLSRNKLVDISPNAFRDLHLVEEIYLESNELKIIYKNMLVESKHLKTLVLTDNLLLDVEPQTFPSLIVLDLNQNSLSNFPEIDAPLLTQLHVGDNSIIELRSSILSGLSKLEFMDISGNSNLSYFNFSIFRNTPKLQELDARRCGILRFVDVEMSSLEVLLLQENLISKIELPVSYYLPAIKQLDLSFNDLTTIQVSMFNTSRTLLSVDLTGNNFHCDCSLQEFVHWIDEQYQHQLVDVVGSPSYLCESPPEAFAQQIQSAVNNLNCDHPGPQPQPSNSSTTVIEIILLVLVVVVIALAIFVAYNSRRMRFCSHHSSSASSLPTEPSSDPSTGLCCAWFASCCNADSRRSFGRGARIRSRARSDDEHRDLMTSPTLSFPVDQQEPEML